MSSKILITTAIAYTNGSPHIGHMYEAILADFLKKAFQFGRAVEVKLLTGTDEQYDVLFMCFVWLV